MKRHHCCSLAIMNILMIWGLIYRSWAMAQSEAPLPLKEMPVMGFGTWMDPEQYRPSDVEGPVEQSLKLGYRHLDCAIAYGNHDKVGVALQRFLKDSKEKVKREDIWITTKYPGMPMDPKILDEAVDRSLQDLGVSYIDLLLIHHPSGGWKESDLATAWKNMNETVKSGKVRHIGVSNFYPHLLQKLIKVAKEEKLPLPYANQVEVNPFAPEEELVGLCQRENIKVTAYAPLGGVGASFVLQNKQILAVSERLKASPAQTVLAWSLRRGLTVIPKAMKTEHIKGNLGSVEIAIRMQDEEAQAITESFGTNYPSTICAQTFKERDLDQSLR